MPKYQTIEFHTGNDSASVFINEDSIGMGEGLESKVLRGVTTDITIKSPGHKDQNEVLMPNHRSTAFWLMQPLNLPTVFIGILYDFTFDKNVSFEGYQNYDLAISKLRLRNDSLEKYLRTGPVSFLDPALISSLDMISAKYPRDPEQLENQLAEAKTDYLKFLESQDPNEFRKKVKKSHRSFKYFEPQACLSVCEYVLDQALEVTHFKENAQHVFRDDANTYQVNGRIDHIEYYEVSGKRWPHIMDKVKLTITWTFENSYGEVIDSVKTEGWSGNLAHENRFDSQSPIYYGFSDAYYVNFLNLTRTDKFAELMVKEKPAEVNYTNLVLAKPSKLIKEKSQAVKAAVTVKTEDGHGSGFAISENGYIITNFHVIAGRSKDNYTGITILDFEGNSHKASVIRFDRKQDLALLKIDHQFNYAFEVLIDSLTIDDIGSTLYAVGTPSSTEMVQTVSMGLLSGLTTNNGVELLQLNMTVNPGNSGGPVFDKSSKLQGVIVAKLNGSSGQGICFAIPAASIQRFLKVSYK